MASQITQQAFKTAIEAANWFTKNISCRSMNKEEILGIASKRKKSDH